MNLPQPLWLGSEHLALASDLYQFKMMAGYLAENPGQQASFELFVRKLPDNRSCLVSCGLEQLVHYLLNLRFTKENIDYLKKHSMFAGQPHGFFEYLSGLRFTGELWAAAEGTPLFADEPFLRITAPIMEAQLFETYALSVINHQTQVASKAALLAEAAGDKPVFEFGMRRAQGPQASLYAARAAYIGGCAGSSNTLASYFMGIPGFGTMSHSWVMSFISEEGSLRSFRTLYPDSALLIDTYHTQSGARTACLTGPGLAAVRLDSGNLAELAPEVRRILDESHQVQAKIVASGDLDENIISRLEDENAPIDVYAVGTELVAGADHHPLSMVYKLVEVKDRGAEWRPTLKFSPGKTTLPGRKQIWRQTDRSGQYIRDLLCLAEEKGHPGEPLLHKVMEHGELVAPLPSLAEINDGAKRKRRMLGSHYFRGGGEESYPVIVSTALRSLSDRLSG